MKNSEVQELSSKELLEKIEEEKALLVRQKMSHAITPLENPHKIKGTRRLIARLMTELRNRELNENMK